MKIAVIGAGVVGVTTAYELLRKGHEVHLFEKNTEAAEECSKANGSQLSVCNTPVWNDYYGLYKGFKYLFKKDAPLKIDLSWDPERYKWLAKFIGNVIYSDYNFHQLMYLGLTSRWRIDEIARELKIDFSYGRGIVKVYKHGIAKKDLLIPDAHEVIGIRKILPGFDGDSLGLLFPYDGFGDANKFTKELLRECRKSKSFISYFGTEVHSIQNNIVIAEVFENVFDKIVICTGSSRLIEVLPIYPVKGYSITINNVSNIPQYSILDDAAKVVATPLGNRLRVAGLAHITDWNKGYDSQAIQSLVKWTKKNLPNVSFVDYDWYNCLRPMTPSMVPIIRPSDKNPHLYFNTGHGHLGWTLACGSALKVAGDISA